jgi:hypothetical protein
LGFLAIEVESGNLRATRADVELEIQFKRVLIPCWIAGAGSVPQNGAGLPVLLQGIERCRMLDRGQGTER